MVLSYVKLHQNSWNLKIIIFLKSIIKVFYVMTSATNYRFEISRICFIMWTQKFTNYKNVI